MNEGLQKFGVSPEQEPFAMGSERTVYQHENPEKVVALDRNHQRNAKQARGEYYLTKIMYLLLPAHIPDIHLYASKPSVSIRQKRELGPEHDFLRNELLAERKGQREEGHGDEYWQTLGDLSEKNEKLMKLLDTLGVQVDYSMPNYGISKNKEAQYIEPFPAFSTNGELLFDKDKIKTAIQKIKDEKKRAKALKYFERLEVLAEEGKKE